MSRLPLPPCGFRWIRLGEKGVAALEFAIIMSFFLVVFIGSFQVLTLLRTSDKLNQLTGNLAQAVSEESPDGSAMSATTLRDLCYGAVKGLQPFGATGLVINIASVTETTVGTTVEYWEQDFTGPSCTVSASQAIGDTEACGLATADHTGGMLPSSSGAIGDNAIIVQAQLTYPGLVGLWLTSSPTLTQTVLTRWAYASTSTKLTETGLTTSSIPCQS
ncbi:TadE/TadG family type IV pilus assembly protein [Acidocella sp.]|uniref:TadE/TadG family type IV pilus assembly protein n=1 Tax=Acidocella sp. TaxID=50710 RepID=UPI003D00594E